MLDYDIILPFYKDYKYLSRCISNINNQLLLPINLIFIDDGNNDKNLKNKITKDLNNKIQLIYIGKKKNEGVNNAVNDAFKKIESEFFYICATDDIINFTFALRSLKILSIYPTSPFVFSNICINNELNNQKIKLDFSFLKKGYHDSLSVFKTFKNNQFKIYHNTVIFRSKFFLEDNIHNNKYGDRCDMLNLYYLSFKYGFVYLNEFLSEFTIRKGQIGTMKNDKYLYNELIYLKKNKLDFYKKYIAANLHYDFSILAVIKFIKYKNYNIISLNWFIRSLKFRIWKFVRFLLPYKLLNILFNLLK